MQLLLRPIQKIFDIFSFQYRYKSVFDFLKNGAGGAVADFDSASLINTADLVERRLSD